MLIKVIFWKSGSEFLNLMSMVVGHECRLTWKQILNILFYVALGWILSKAFSISFSVEPAFQQNTNITNNPMSCLYYPSSQYYRLRLQPKTNVFPIEELTSNDYEKLINLTDFRFSINEPDKCSKSNVLLLVLVTSAVQNVNRRNTIRSTWGQQDSKIRVLFMLGTVLNDTRQHSVQREYYEYGDIVQGNFIDSYRNLSYKSIMAFKYAIYHCSSATYIFKTDDDVFLNVPLMKNYLVNDLSPFGAENLLQCIVFTENRPLRFDSKWTVTEEEFPGSKFPIYCNGAWALFSPDVLFNLYKEAQNIKFLYLEDVFIYGLAGGKVKGLSHSDIRNLTLSYEDPSLLSSGAYDNINFLIGTFGMTDQQLEEYWHYVINRPVRSSVYDYSEFSGL